MLGKILSYGLWMHWFTIKIIRTYVEIYGNVFEGNELMEQTIRFIPNTEEVSEILWDYDLVPILWN